MLFIHVPSSGCATNALHRLLRIGKAARMARSYRKVRLRERIPEREVYQAKVEDQVKPGGRRNSN